MESLLGARARLDSGPCLASNGFHFLKCPLHHSRSFHRRVCCQILPPPVRLRLLIVTLRITKIAHKKSFSKSIKKSVVVSTTKNVSLRVEIPHFSTSENSLFFWSVVPSLKTETVTSTLSLSLLHNKFQPWTEAYEDTFFYQYQFIIDEELIQNIIFESREICRSFRV